MRANIAGRVADAVRRETPTDPEGLVGVVCGAVDVPFRDLCRSDRLRELMRPLGIELKGDDAVDRFESWRRIAFESVK